MEEGPGSPSPPLLPPSFLGHLFEYPQRLGSTGVFICLNMGGSYRRGCRVSRLEDQCKQTVGGLETEVGKGGSETEPTPFLCLQVGMLTVV